MDMVLPEEVVRGRKRKTGLILLGTLAALCLSVMLIRSSMRPSLKSNSITTAVATRGDIENTLTASGVVSPEFEEVITSPINAQVQKVLADAGSPVRAGQSILTLDKSATQAALAKLQFQLESGRNNIRKLKLQLDKSYFDLKSNNDIKQLRINSLQAAVENAKRLYRAGGGTREDVEQAELNLKVALLEKLQLENEITSKQQTMQVEMRESEIAARIQENDLHDLERKLQLADLVASRAGVVTWVNKNIGATVREGESLARIADLGSFSITGSISDSYLNQLRPGLGAIIRINDTQLRGTIVKVLPAIQNGIVSFNVRPDEQDSGWLRPDMKVDIYVITAVKRGVVRVTNGPAFKGASAQDIFVVRDGMALRRSVHTGMSNFDYVEVTDNLQPGETVILSDMSEYRSTGTIEIKKN